METFKSNFTILFLLCFCPFFAGAQSVCGNTQADFIVTQSGSVTMLQSTSAGVPSGALYQWWVNGNAVTNPDSNQVYTVGVLPDGNYVFCLYVYADMATFCDSVCRNHAVTSSNPCDSLNAEFTQTYNADGSVQFTSVPNSGSVTHFWDFGDGTSASTPNPLHCYANAGGRWVSHRVEIPGTVCFDTIGHYVQSGVSSCADLCAGFSVSVDSVTTPNGTFLQPNASGGTAPYTYAWNNGVTSPVVTNPTPGIYCVTVIDANACSATSCDTVHGSPCDANFSWYLAGGCDSVQFVSTGLSAASSQYQWNFGDGTSSTLANPIHVFSAIGTYTVVLTVYDANSQCQNSYTAVIPIQSCERDTICGTVFNDLNNNGVMDSTETGLVSATVYVDNTVVMTDSFGHYTAIVPVGSHSVRIVVPQGCVLTLPLNPNNNTTSGHYFFSPSSSQGGTYCGYNFGIHCSAVTICGAVYVDANNNQVRENGEVGISSVHLTLTGTNGNVYHAYTNPNGNYCVTVPAGTYTVTVVSTVFGTLSTPSITVNASTIGNTYNNNDFPVYVQSGTCDLKIDIFPQSTVTPGFPVYYYVRVRNTGGNIVGGTLELMYEPSLSYISSSPVGTDNATAYTVSWNVSPLVVGAYRDYFVRFTASTQLALGQPVFALASLITDAACTDVNLNNNIDTLHQTVTGSWDPNNKLAYKTNHENNTDFQWISTINADQRLEYVINFQNEGNGPAVNVVVKNVITPDLDLNSFELLGMSHDGVVVRNDSEFNFKFSNIMLAPKDVDEPNSSGWVRYAINAVSNLPAGHIIAEPADIYFDFNEAVVTNDGAVILLDVTGIGETAHEQIITVAPNPMSDYTRITLNNPQADGFRFRVTDITGRIVNDETVSGNSLLFNRNALSAGLYTYQVIQNNNITAKGKLIMQ